MIDVRVGENHRAQARQIDRHRRPVSLAQFLQPLEQAAIDQDLIGVLANKNFDPVTPPAAPRNCNVGAAESP